MTHIITPISVGSLLFNLGPIFRLPEGHPENGRKVHVPITSYHIALPNRSVLVDAVSYEPEQMGRMLIPDFVPPPPLVEQLRANGIDPEAISDVIITHLHFDHFSGVTSLVNGRHTLNFPNARHYLGAGDWNPADFHDLEKRTVNIVHNEGRLELITEKTALGDGLSILPTPGETPGHQAVALDYDGRTTYFIGDLFHHEIEFIYPDIHVFWSDMAVMPITKAAFLREAVSTDHHIYCAHINGPYQVRAEGGGYVWQPVSI